jgi:hypothetical protein
MEDPSVLGDDLQKHYEMCINPLPPDNMCRTAPLTSRRCILNIYSTNTHTEYFKHAA